MTRARQSALRIRLLLLIVGIVSRAVCLATIFKVTLRAEKTGRALNGSSLLSEVIRGVQFVGGVKIEVA